jgi:hypothetical protein
MSVAIKLMTHALDVQKKVCNEKLLVSVRTVLNDGHGRRRCKKIEFTLEEHQQQALGFLGTQTKAKEAFIV